MSANATSRPPSAHPTSIALRSLRKRPVVDIGTAETIGRIRSARVDPATSSVVSFVVRGGDGGVVPFDRVQGMGQDAVTVPSSAALVPDEETLPSDADAYGSRVLDEDGNDLGKLDDLHITEDGTIHQIVLGGEIHDRSLIGIGSYAVVVSRPRRAAAGTEPTSRAAAAPRADDDAPPPSPALEQPPSHTSEEPPGHTTEHPPSHTVEEPPEHTIEERPSHTFEESPEYTTQERPSHAFEEPPPQDPRR